MSTSHRPRKSLGQNFLTDPATQLRIADAIEPHESDTVVEIGPGQGALTRHLAGRVRRLILVELDDSLAAALTAQYARRDDVEVINQDFLALDLCNAVGGGPFKVIGNIPYNITTPIIFRLLERACRPQLIVIMVQRELADRVLSPEGSKTYGALSVGVQALADVKRLFHVGRGSFFPVPNVDSTVMRITPHDPPRLSAQEEIDLRALTRTAFGWRRKQLQKILRAAPVYEAAADIVETIGRSTGTVLTARPETLSPPQFINLARALREQGLPASVTDESLEWE